MNDRETLKKSRNLLLKLHKTMIDMEREMYEGIHGQLTAGAFLNVLLEDEGFAWLRKFSMLIVEIDELFAIRDGFSQDVLDATLVKTRELVDMKDDDLYFRAKYELALQHSPEAAGLQSELRTLLFKPTTP